MIENPALMGRLKDFAGIPLGMTDIDGLFEYHDKGYLFLELKCNKNTSMSVGQRRAFLRLIDDLTKVKPAVLVVARHGDGLEPIRVATCEVDRYYMKGEWRPGRDMTVAHMVSQYIKFLDGGKNG